MLAGRGIQPGRKFLPDGLACMGGFGTLPPAARRLVNQIQGRTYARMLGHQPRFRHLEALMAAVMPAGHRCIAEPGMVASVVPDRSQWSVHALTCLIGLLARAHYRQSIDPDPGLDPLWKDLLHDHWKEASQRAILDDLAWRGENARLDGAARDQAVGDLIALLGAVDGIVQEQARLDAAYFARVSGRPASREEEARVEAGLLHAYRWQYILSGVQVPHFGALLSGMLNAAQYGRVAAALAPLFDAAQTPAVRAVA